MHVTVAPRPFGFAGIPWASWAFAIRIWIAVVVALYAGFWLQLDAASSAAVTVAILAVPTRGQTLEKAGFRLIATVIGVTASIVIVGIFAQARDLLLAAFAAWVGLCIYAAGLSDGNRAYAAVLSGYTVALVAMQQIDTSQHVFDSGIQRGAAIAVGIAAIALVNDLLVAPDRHTGLAAQLAALHRRVRDHAKAVIRGEATDPVTTTGLLREIAMLRSERTSLATESSSGSTRSAAAGSTAVALVVQLHAVRVLNALPIAADPALRDRLTSALEQDSCGRSAAPSLASPVLAENGRSSPMAASVAWASEELLRRDREACENLAALKSGIAPVRAWRTPIYFCHRIAAEAGVRAALWLAMASAVFVLAGWPSADASLSLVAVVIGLGATAPNPRGFTVMALIAVPMAAVLAGVLEFLILDGVTEFPLLALALAPFVVGAAVLTTRPNPALSSLGRLNLIFILAIVAPSNPQTYDPQAYLFSSLFACLGTAVLFAAQLLIPPVTDERRRQWLIASARREVGRLPSGRPEGYSPEEAMFRDAVRIGQIAAAGVPDPAHRAVVEEALALFDRAGLVGQSEASLGRLADGPLADLADEARDALIRRDAPVLRRAALRLHEAAAEGAPAADASRALFISGLVFEGGRA